MISNNSFEPLSIHISLNKISFIDRTLIFNVIYMYIFVASLKRGILGKSFSKSISRSKEERIITDGKDLLNIVNGNNQTVIHICIQKRYYDLLQMFLNEGADITIQDKYGHNGLHEAAIRNDTTVLNKIIQHLKDKEEAGDRLLKNLLMTKNVKGESPIELACEIDSISVRITKINMFYLVFGTRIFNFY